MQPSSMVMRSVGMGNEAAIGPYAFCNSHDIRHVYVIPAEAGIRLRVCRFALSGHIETHGNILVKAAE
jgi:hypothetical protein